MDLKPIPYVKESFFMFILEQLAQQPFEKMDDDTAKELASEMGIVAPMNLWSSPDFEYQEEDHIGVAGLLVLQYEHRYWVLLVDMDLNIISSAHPDSELVRELLKLDN